MSIRTLRLAVASVALILPVVACTTPAGSSPTVPASVASAAGSAADAFCDLDLRNDPEIKAAVDAATTASTGGAVDEAAISTQVDAAIADIEAVEVTGDAATAQTALVGAMNAFGDNPSQTTAAAVITAHGATVTAQTAACGS